MLFIRGTVVHTPVRGHVEVLLDRLLVVDVDGGGKIASMVSGEEEANCLALYSGQAEDVLRLSADQFLLPGFIDTHIHAPQYAFAGTATDTPLMDWLNKVQLPLPCLVDMYFRSNACLVVQPPCRHECCHAICRWVIPQHHTCNCAPLCSTPSQPKLGLPPIPPLLGTCTAGSSDG